eukprot:UN31302
MTECSWVYGTITGFKLYQNSALCYPFVIKTNNIKDKVFGCLCSWDDEIIFNEKFKMCDRIEGYNPNSKDNLYEREIVKITATDEKNDSLDSWVYHQTKYSQKEIDIRNKKGKVLL